MLAQQAVPAVSIKQQKSQLSERPEKFNLREQQDLSILKLWLGDTFTSMLNQPFKEEFNLVPMVIQ